MAVGRLAASAATAHAPFSEVLALAGEAQSRLGGGRGAMMFASMIQGLETAAAKGKAEIDFSHGLVAALRQLKEQLTGTPIERLGQLKEMGISGGPQMLQLLDNLDQFAAKQKQIGDSAGALSKAYGTATANMADATKRLTQNWQNLADALATPALGLQAQATNFLSDRLGALTKHVENHSRIAGVAAISLGLVGDAAYHAVNAMSSIGTMAILAGRGWDAMATIGPKLGGVISSLSTTAMTLQGSIGGVVSLTNLWSLAQWAVNAAFIASPIGWFVAGAVALGVAAYEIYKHWDAVAGFFKKLWADVKGIFSEAVTWMGTAGAEMVKALGAGIMSAIEYPVKAAENLAARIGGYFHFHSPPAFGPLHDALVNFRFGEELARRINPAPAVAAEHVAAVMARPHPASGGGGTIVVNYSPQVTLNGATGSPADFKAILREHADELMRVIDAKLNRRKRLAFE
jgi:hypothetical protein